MREANPRTLSTAEIFAKLAKVFQRKAVIGDYRADLLAELRDRCDSLLNDWNRDRMNKASR